MADIGATVREISSCLEAVAAEGGRQHDDNTSASFAAPISSLSTDTPSSLTVSFGGMLSSPAQDVNVSRTLLLVLLTNTLAYERQPKFRQYPSIQRLSFGILIRCFLELIFSGI